MIIRTILEAIAIALLIYGFCHEQQIINFEQKLFKNFIRRINHDTRR